MTSQCKHNDVCARFSATGHKDGTCTVALKCVHCSENHASYKNKCSFYKRQYYIQYIRVSNNVSFYEARNVYQQSHGQKVMNYAGAVKAPVQSTSICREMCHGSAKNLLLGSSVLLPLLLSGQFSRSVGTSTRVADVKKTVAPPKKGEKSTNLFMSLILILQSRRTKGKVRRVPLSQVYISPNKIHELYSEQGTAEKILSGFRFST